MKKQLLLLLVVSAVFARAQNAVRGSGAIWEAPKVDLRWTPVVEMDENLFPSAIIAAAKLHIPAKPQAAGRAGAESTTLGDPAGWLSVRVFAPHDGARISVRIKCKALMEESEGTFVLPHAGKTYDVRPEIAWDFDGLRTNHGAKPETISFSVAVDNNTPETKTKRVVVRSINDCLTGAIENGRFVNFPIFFPAYVNEDHPWVGQLLNEAKKSGTIREFLGYQSHNTQDVYKQVYSVWNVMQRRGLTYSSILTVAPNSNRVRSQEVRFLEQSISTTQANCVDGSVLFASILRKIGLEPFLVQIPGHMFVGFYLDQEHKQPQALETTMMGMIDLRKFAEDHTLTAGLNQLVGADTKNSASWKTFVAAITEGNKKYDASVPHINKHESDCAIIDITAVRKLGVLPIAYGR